MHLSNVAWSMVLVLVPILACNGDDSGDDDAADSAADDETPASDDFAPGDDDSNGSDTGGSNSGGSTGDSTGPTSVDGSSDAGTGGGACVEAGQLCGPNDYCNTWLCGCLNSETEFMTIGVCDAGVCEANGTLACTPICEPNGGIASAVDGGCG